MSIKGALRHPLVETVIYLGTVIGLAVLLYYGLYGV